MERKQNLTIDDIARDLGVSKTTVSRAISGKGRISPATRSRIQEYIQKCNYRPNAAAKSLAESRTYNVALVLPKTLFKLDMPFIRKSMGAVCEEAFLQDYNILICLSTDDNPAPLLRTLDNRKVDGVILSRTVDGDTLVDLLNQRGIPFATIGSLPAEKKGMATVEADHDQVGGCRAFTMACLRSNQEKIALLGRDMNYVVNQSRVLGFRQAAAAFGLSESQAVIRHSLRNYRECAGAVDQLLSQGFHRFLAMDEETCLRILEHIAELGLRCPEDVQIASLYDSDQLAAHTPPVSALQFDAAALGRVACRELLRYLKNEEYDPSPTLGYRILTREST